MFLHKILLQLISDVPGIIVFRDNACVDFTSVGDFFLFYSCIEKGLFNKPNSSSNTDHYKNDGRKSLHRVGLSSQVLNKVP